MKLASISLWCGGSFVVLCGCVTPWQEIGAVGGEDEAAHEPSSGDQPMGDPPDSTWSSQDDGGSDGGHDTSEEEDDDDDDDATGRRR